MKTIKNILNNQAFIASAAIGLTALLTYFFITG
jgi:hypothetical protein